MKLKTLFFAAAILGLFSASFPVGAVVNDMVELGNSVMPVDPTPGLGHRPYVSRAALTASEADAPLNFELTLRMRNTAELQARIARGEKISRQEMAQKYEPTATEYNTLAAWAEKQGFVVTRRSDNHLALFVQGSVTQVSRALQVHFSRVNYRGHEYTSAVTAPRLPAALSQSLLGINGLQPHLRPHKHSVRKNDQIPASSSNGPYRPKQIAAAYNALALYDNNITGSGEAIAIVIDTFPATSDLQRFWTAGNITQSLSNIQFIQAVPGQLADPSGEESLDVEWASGIAPGAKVRVYASLDLNDSSLDQAYQQVLDDATQHPEFNIHQMSMSYGGGESTTSSSQLDTDAQYFAELTAAGVTCFASSGDGGSTPDSNGNENGRLEAENPASDPSVTGVGGTSLQYNPFTGALNESVWNDPIIDSRGIVISGGTTGGGVSSHFARPSWQTGRGVNTNAKRQVPDLAATADPQAGGYVYLGGQQQVYGGTSWSSPVCAGFCALINQARANSGLSPIGLLNSHLYPQVLTNNFRDITSGNNATNISNGKYTATVGYDECTGVGVPLMQALTATLTGSSSNVGISQPVASIELPPGRTASFTVNVSGATATYQWQRQPVTGSSFSNLSDDATYSGSTTATLTITNLTTAMSGDQFQCVITLPGSTVTTSPPSNLAVETPLQVSALAGQARRVGGTNGTGTGALFNYPSGIALDASGNLYVADYANNQIRKVTPAGLTTSPFGSASRAAGSNDGTGNAATFNQPNGIAVDGSGQFYVADSGNNSVRKISGETVSTLATGFNSPLGVAVDVSGNVYVADTQNNVIREIAPNGTVSTLAGSIGSSGSQDGSAASAQFNAPAAVAVDGSGAVYVADTGNFTIRKISGGTVTTVAGIAGQAGYLDGRASTSLFNAPLGLAFDVAGNLLITDGLVPAPTSNAAGNCVLRRLSSVGAVTTVAGNPGVSGSTNGVGSSAEFFSPQAVACDATGPIYVADAYNQELRLVGTSSANSSPQRATVTLSNLIVTYDGSAHAATVTTSPAGLAVNVTYNGNATATEAGSYAVVATVSDAIYSGTASGTLIIKKGVATLALTNLVQAYDGSPKPASASTTPAGLSVAFSYNNSASVPVNVGSYAVVGTISDVNYTGSANGTLVITKPAAQVMLNDLAQVYNGGAKTITATTVPPGLKVIFTYNGSTRPPALPGSYVVKGTVSDLNYSGSASDTLVISKGTATVSLGSLTAIYNGKPHLATATTVPAGLPVSFTYAGGTTPPTAVGSYAVMGTINSTTYNGSAADTLVITPIPPLAVTSLASAIHAESATLNGSVNPEGSLTTIRFQYGPTTAYGTQTAEVVAGTGNLAVAGSAAAPGLTPQTPYHFRTVATSQDGKVHAYGLDRIFITLGKPTVNPAATPLVAASGAKVSKPITPNGSATTVYFEYGLTTAYGSTTPVQSVGFGKTPVTVSAFFSGLLANSTYHYALVTVSAAGTYTWPDETLSTLGFDTSLVVANGDAAADVPGAKFLSFGNGIINAQDGVAFAARLALGFGGATAANQLGIWADNASLTRALVARVGNAAPDTGGTFATLSDPVYNAHEDVAFAGTLKVVVGQATNATAAGLWSSTGGTLGLLARAGGTAPGANGATFAVLGSPVISDNGGTVFSATLAPSVVAGVTAANNAGIWTGTSNADLALVLRTGELTDSGKFVSQFSFLPTVPVVNGQTRGFAPGTGHVAMHVVYTDKNTGILRVSGAGTTPVAVETSTDLAAGTNAARYATFSNPAINDQDHVAYLATLTVGEGDTTKVNAGGIWADDLLGVRQLVVRLGGLAPGTIGGTSFVALGDPAYNANEKVAFRGTLSMGVGQATAATATGLWSNGTGALQLVARQGDQAASCPPFTVYSAFTALALDDVHGATQKGGVIFQATLAGGGATAANNVGIFAEDAHGVVQLVARTGDVLNGKTVTALSFLPLANGQARSFARETGDLLYTATFSDRTTAIFSVTYP